MLRLGGLETCGGRGGLGFGGGDVTRLLSLGLCERGLGGLHVSGCGLLGRFSTLEFRGCQRTFGGQFVAACKKFRGPLQHRLGGIEFALRLRHGGGIFRQGKHRLGSFSFCLGLGHPGVILRQHHRGPGRRLGIESLQKGILRRAQFGALDGEQHVALFHRVTQARLHVGHASIYQRTHVRHGFLIERHARRRGKSGPQYSLLHGSQFNPMLLDGRRRKRNLCGGIFPGVVVMVIVRVPSMRVVMPVASATTAQPKWKRGNRENVNQCFHNILW